MTKTRGQLISMFQHMKTMSNDNAIKHIRHEDIDTTCGYLLEDKQEIEKLEKALDKACKELSSHTVECDLVQCPFNCEYDSCDFDCGNTQKWKEWCMRDEE